MHFISKSEKVEHVSDINAQPIPNPQLSSENSLVESGTTDAVLPERVKERNDERETVDPPSKRVKV